MTSQADTERSGHPCAEPGTATRPAVSTSSSASSDSRPISPTVVLAASVVLALNLGQPLLLEGAAGVGRTEVAKAGSAGAGVLALAAGADWLATAGVMHLPQIMAAGDYFYLTRHQGPYIVGLNLLALLVVVRYCHREAGEYQPERWVLVAATASLADVVLVLLAEARFTLVGTPPAG
jgi:hypothetical protein